MFEKNFEMVVMLILRLKNNFMGNFIFCKVWIYFMIFFLNLGEIVVLFYNIKCKLGIMVWLIDDVILISIFGNICWLLCNLSEIGYCYKKWEIGFDEICIYRVLVIILYVFDFFLL